MVRNSSSGRRWPALLLSGIAAFLLILVSLPFWLERLILPSVLVQNGLAGYRVAVSGFGPTGAAFHLIAEDDESIVSSGTVLVDWTLPGLWQRRLSRVTCTGFLVRFPLSQDTTIRQPNHQSAAGSFSLPVVVDNFRVSNTTILLRSGNLVFPLPVRLSALLQEQAAQSGEVVSKYRVELALAQQHLAADIELDPKAGALTGSLQSRLNLVGLATFLPQAVSITKSRGTADLNAGFDLGISPFVLHNLETRIEFDDLEMGGERFSLQALGESKPLLTLTGSESGYSIKGSGFAFTHPFRAALELNAGLDMEGDGLLWHGDVMLKPEAGQEIAPRWMLESSPPIELLFTGGSHTALNAVLQSGNSGAQPLPFVFRSGETSLQLASLRLETQPVHTPSEMDKGTSYNFTLNGGLMDFESETLKGRIPEINLQGGVAIPKGKGPSAWQVNGNLRFAKSSLDLKEQDIHLTGMALTLPFAWPGPSQPVTGDFHIASLDHGETRTGSFSGRVEQVGRGLSLQGEFETVFTAGTPIRLSSILQIEERGLPQFEADLSLEDTRLALTDIAHLYPEIGSLGGSADVAMQGSIHYDSCGLDGEISAQLADGNFSVPDAHLSLEDVRLDIRVPSLRRVATEPGHALSIGTLRSNKLVMNDIRAFYRVESPESLFIEGISGKWSGGRIFSSGFRIHRDMRELEFALFCDRLQLAEMLSQFNLADARGSGSLSGRIPLVYRDGDFFVDDGFLFTAPGERGSLKIDQSKYLAVGLPADVPQFSPLHFAGAALRDFEYNWAKLNVYSEEENLLLKLQIDGRPGEKLPYRFDPVRNVFIRMPEGQAGMDQPVKLDVNFKVPVNELFRYQKSLMPLLQNLR